MTVSYFFISHRGDSGRKYEKARNKAGGKQDMYMKFSNDNVAVKINE